MLTWNLESFGIFVCDFGRKQKQHRKKRFTSFPSPAGMSLTKLPLGRNNSVMTSLFPPRESLVVGTGNSLTFFYGELCGQACNVLTFASWNLEILGIAVCDFGRKQEHLCGQEYDMLTNLTFTSWNWESSGIAVGNFD